MCYQQVFLNMYLIVNKWRFFTYSYFIHHICNDHIELNVPYTCVQFWSLKISGQIFLYVAWVISMGTELNSKKHESTHCFQQNLICFLTNFLTNNTKFHN